MIPPGEFPFSFFAACMRFVAMLLQTNLDVYF